MSGMNFTHVSARSQWMVPWSGRLPSCQAIICTRDRCRKRHFRSRITAKPGHRRYGEALGMVATGLGDKGEWTPLGELRTTDRSRRCPSLLFGVVFQPPTGYVDAAGEPHSGGMPRRTVEIAPPPWTWPAFQRYGNEGPLTSSLGGSGPLRRDSRTCPLGTRRSR